MICNIVILWMIVLVSDGSCRMRMRPARLVSYAFLYTTRTCSVVVPGTCRNSHSGNGEPNGDRSLNDRCPETVVSSHHPGNLNDSEMEEYPNRRRNVM